MVGQDKVVGIFLHKDHYMWLPKNKKSGPQKLKKKNYKRRLSELHYSYLKQEKLQKLKNLQMLLTQIRLYTPED